MYSLQRLLTILDGQQLSAGYLTPAGSGTALETVIALMNQFSPYVLLQNPLPIPTLLVTPAWIASLDGQDAIYLAAVDGNLDLSKAGPAFRLGGAASGGGGGGGTLPTVWGLVQHSYKHDGTTSLGHTYNYPSANTAGNLLTAVIGWFSSAGNQGAPTVSDTVNGPWTQAGALALHSVDIVQGIWFRANCLAGSPTLNITFPNAAPVDVQGQEWSGAATTSPNDVNATGHGGSGTTAPTASATTTTPNQLILGGLTTYDGSAYSPGSGFTALDNNVPNGAGSEYKILATAGSVNVDFNHGSNEWVSSMATFKFHP